MSDLIDARAFGRGPFCSIPHPPVDRRRAAKRVGNVFIFSRLRMGHRRERALAIVAGASRPTGARMCPASKVGAGFAEGRRWAG